MKAMLRFESRRLGRDRSFILSWSFYFILFAIYALLLHLGRVGSLGEGSMPMNVTYASYAFKEPWAVLAIIISVMAAASVQRDLKTGIIETILTQQVSRSSYVAGKATMFSMLGILGSALLGLLAWAIADMIFSGRPPIDAADVEAGRAWLFARHCLSVILTSFGVVPPVLIGIGLALVACPLVAVAAAISVTMILLRLYAQTVLAPAILPDYSFAVLPPVPGADSIWLAGALVLASLLIHRGLDLVANRVDL